MEEYQFKNCCFDLQNVLSDGDSKDINEYELYKEFIIFVLLFLMEQQLFKLQNHYVQVCFPLKNCNRAF